MRFGRLLEQSIRYFDGAVLGGLDEVPPDELPGLALGEPPGLAPGELLVPE